MRPVRQHAAAVELGAHGGDRRSETARENQVDSVKLKHDGGNGREYTFAGLERDGHKERGRKDGKI